MRRLFGWCLFILGVGAAVISLGSLLGLLPFLHSGEGDRTASTRWFVGTLGVELAVAFAGWRLATTPRRPRGVA
jgi:hypothetical protein